MAACLVIAGASAWLFAALFDRTGFASHERIWPYTRTLEYLRELTAGRFPQTLPDAFAGGGHAFPRFYPPFAYAAAVLASVAVGDVILGVHLSLLLSVILSGIAMYWMARRLGAGWAAALFAALLYVSVPYRFVDVFVRGALAESWTFVWYPLIVGGAWRGVRDGRFSWALPLGIAGLVLSHAVMALYFMALIGVIGAVLLRAAPRRMLALVVPAAILGAGLTAWFVLPQQQHLAGVWASDPDHMWTSAAFVHAHRVMPAQLLTTDPERWWGRTTIYPEDGMSFALGVGQLLLVPLALVYAWRVRRAKGAGDELEVALIVMLVAAWCVVVGFMVAPGPVLLALPDAFSYLQFSWRLLGIAAFVAAAALALILQRLTPGPIGRAAVALAGVALVLSVPGFQRDARRVDGLTASALTESVLRSSGALGFTMVGEYLPREIVPEQAASEVAAAPRVNGPARILQWSKDGAAARVRVIATGASEVVFPLVHYDFYRAESGALTLPIHSRNGLVAATLPAGEHEIIVQPRITGTTWAGVAVAGAAALGLLLLARANRREVIA